jgi:hypothetical protein
VSRAEAQPDSIRPTPEQLAALAEQHATWSRAPLALRASQVPAALVGADPELALMAAYRRGLFELEQEDRLRFEDWQMQSRKLQADYAQAQQDALVLGLAPPPPLVLEPWTGVEHPRTVFDPMHVTLEAAERGILASGVDRLRGALEERSAKDRDRLANAQRQVRDAEEALQPANAALAVLDSLTPSGDVASRGEVQRESRVLSQAGEAFSPPQWPPAAERSRAR